MFNKQNKSYFKLQICDVISRWEKSYQDFHSGKLDSNKTIRFLYKNRLVFCNWVVLFSNWVRIHLHVYWYILFLSPMIMCITLRRPFKNTCSKCIIHCLNRGKKIILLIFIDLLHLIKTFFVMIPIIFVLFTQVVLQKPKCIRDREGKITLRISN